MSSLHPVPGWRGAGGAAVLSLVAPPSHHPEPAMLQFQRQVSTVHLQVDKLILEMSFTQLCQFPDTWPFLFLTLCQFHGISYCTLQKIPADFSPFPPHSPLLRAPQLVGGVEMFTRRSKEAQLTNAALGAPLRPGAAGGFAAAPPQVSAAGGKTLSGAAGPCSPSRPQPDKPPPLPPEPPRRGRL